MTERTFKVFTNSDWALLGFAVVQPTLRQDDMTSKLNIREHPPTAQLVSLLERQPPKDHETAQQWFSVLAGRIARAFRPIILFLSAFNMSLSQSSPTRNCAPSPACRSYLSNLVRARRPRACYLRTNATS